MARPDERGGPTESRRDTLTQGPMTIEQIHSGFLAAPDFKIAEAEAVLSVRLSKQMRLAAGVGYRFTGSDHHGFGSNRLDGATGSLALQIGGRL